MQPLKKTFCIPFIGFIALNLGFKDLNVTNLGLCREIIMVIPVMINM